MAEAKTKATGMSVSTFLSGVQPEARRQECETLVRVLKKATREEPQLWGSSLVGFGRYHYVYESGREGDWPLCSFSPRKANITLYLPDGLEPHATLLARLGTFTTGKACLHIKTLSDIDLAVLEKLVTQSVKATKATHGA